MTNGRYRQLATVWLNHHHGETLKSGFAYLAKRWGVSVGKVKTIHKNALINGGRELNLAWFESDWIDSLVRARLAFFKSGTEELARILTTEQLRIAYCCPQLVVTQVLTYANAHAHGIGEVKVLAKAAVMAEIHGVQSLDEPHRATKRLMAQRYAKSQLFASELVFKAAAGDCYIEQLLIEPEIGKQFLKRLPEIDMSQ